jgi:hypothetical protein
LAGTQLSPWIARVYPTSSGNEIALAAAVFYEGETDVYVSRFDLQEERADHSVLSRTVEIPLDLQSPVLSLFYAYASESDTENDQLTIYVDDGTTITPLASIGSPANWTHAWFDMANWLGQTITITLDLSTTANGRFTWVYLDDTSLGSWLTPVIHEVSPSRVEAWTTTAITVAGANFIATSSLRLNDIPVPDVQWLDERTLRATLPADLSPGVYHVWVTNPGGQEAALPGGLNVGTQVYLPMLFRGYASSASTPDNLHRETHSLYQPAPRAERSLTHDLESIPGFRCFERKRDEISPLKVEILQAPIVSAYGTGTGGHKVLSEHLAVLKNSGVPSS